MTDGILESDPASLPGTGNEDLADLPFNLTLELTVDDPALVAELLAHEEGRCRDEYALCALRIGLLALKQARGQLDADTLQRESERLLESLDRKLSLHARELTTQLASSLKDYFDPESGRFQERVQRLIKKDGELEQVLRHQIGSQDSELCKTLALHVGAQSPLLKLLSPKESEGLFQALTETLNESLRGQRECILTEFSLNNKDGALARLVAELTQNHGKLSGELQNKINEVVKEFSLNEKDSALSRLVRRVTRAQKTISQEFTLDNKSSALARLKGELLEVLSTQKQDNQKFQEEVKSSLAAMVARREETDRSIRHGMGFEKAVGDFIQHESQKAGDIWTATGMTTGQIKNCKIGDHIIELGPESAAAGAKIVVEAKEQAQYTIAAAREEIEVAHKNRAAQVGLFVFSRKTAPEGFKPLVRLGNDVFVVWDAEDIQSDLYLETAITLAKYLCSSQAGQREAQAADFTAIDEAILEIEKRAGQLDQMSNWTKTIQSNSGKIQKQIGAMKKALLRQIKILREKTSDLKGTVGSSDSNDERGVRD